MEKTGGTILPGYRLKTEIKSKGSNTKLTEEHSLFLDNYVERYPTCIIKDATALLCAAFEDLKISDSAVHRHVTEKLEFILTRTQARVAERNSESTIEQRRQFVEHIEENKINFKNKYVFVDESGFKKNMVRPVAWSHKGTPAEVEVLCANSINLSIMGCISAYGLVAISQQVPKSNSTKKQKKWHQF